jgi:conjugal transfer pilus assembly protein TraV
MHKTVTLLVATLLVTGCGSLVNPYHESFSCKASDEGGACVDTMTAYADAQVTEPADNRPMRPSLAGVPGQDAATARAVYEDRYYRRLAGILEEPQVPVIEPPKIMRVLVMPYKGEGGELFMPRYSFIQVEDARWVLAESQTAR